ncbi:MAG TPA: gamma-glutamyltransferase family protein [Actinomycetota bacterium]|nr:gamma-glutamyltransferase family protein [Actinomycetota bacterium]
MVASTHWLASASGMAVLERGGNAFDAAVAAGLTLQVVEPHLNGPGGEVPILLYDERRGEVEVICGQGPSPAMLSVEHFEELGLDIIPGSGSLAACVPGAFDAWMLLLRDHGTMPLGEVMSYALHYAEHGYPVLPQIAGAIAAAERQFRHHWRSSAEVYLTGDGPPAAGSRWRNPVLARTYHRLLSESESATADREGQIEAARRVFYEGFVAEAMLDFMATEVMDSSGEAHAGVMDDRDLADWQATVESPLWADYHGYRVFKTQPWSQGPVFLQQLNLLAGFDVRGMGHNTAEYIHTVVECAKLAFADREAYYGDPIVEDVPVDELLGEAYARDRRALVGERASLELRPGSVGGRVPRLPLVRVGEAGSAGGTGEPTVAETRGDTCHVDVVDRHGNLVSATPSGGWLQSNPVIPELGFPLGTRAQMFWLERDLPNSLRGSKRPRTTLTPSLAFKHGDPYLAFGTPGGDSQDQWSLSFFLNHVHFGLDLQAAIDAPTWHTTHFPSSFYPRESHPGEIVVEGRLGESVVSELEQRGHRVVVEEDWALGRVSGAGVDPDTGMLRAAANPRGMQGYATGR